MLHRCLALLMAVVFLSACGDAAKPEMEAVQDTYVTNAEYVLGKIQDEGAAGIVLHLKPRVKTSCAYMYAEISHRAGPDEPWEVIAAMWPGKNPKEKYGERFIENQMYFMALTTEGPHALTAFGCKPVNGESQVVRGVFSIFTPEPGKLSYLGEVGPWDTRKMFLKVDFADRRDMALEKVTHINPELASYFTPAVMEKYVRKLTPEEEASLNASRQIVKDLKIKQDVRRNAVSRYNEARDSYLTLKAVYGGTSSKLLSPDAQAERDMLIRNMTVYNASIEKIDQMIASRKSGAQIQKYAALQKAYDAAAEEYEAYRKQVPPSVRIKGTDAKMERINRKVSRARRELERFEASGASSNTASTRKPRDAERDRLVRAYKRADAAYTNSIKGGILGSASVETFRRNIHRVKANEAEYALSRYDQIVVWKNEGKSQEFIDTASGLLEAADEADIAYNYHYAEHGKDVPRELIAERNALYNAAQESEKIYEEYVGAR